MAAADNEKLARSIYELYNKRQIDQMVALASDQVEVLIVPHDDTQRGRDGYRKYVQNWATGFPDSRVEVKNVTASETSAAVEFIGRGTHSGVLDTPMGKIQPTGRKMELRFCDLLQLEGGKVSRVHAYFDLHGMMEQLGLLPQQATSARRDAESPSARPH